MFEDSFCYEINAFGCFSDFYMNDFYVISNQFYFIFLFKFTTVII